MQVPNSGHASIDGAKLVDYLLSPDHPTGRGKHAFFSRLGYSATHWTLLASDLRRHLLAHPVAGTAATPYGVKYTVRGSLETPSGRSVMLVSVWMILATEDFPRFVTAYPGARP